MNLDEAMEVITGAEPSCLEHLAGAVLVAEVERLRAEVKRLDMAGTHSCHDDCQRLPCAQRREIERLRAELAACQNLLDETRTELSICGAFHSLVKEGWQLELEKVNRLEAELAEAKAASVCPARVQNIYDAEYPSDCYIECWNGDECMKFRDWLYDRIKERGEG